MTLIHGMDVTLIKRTQAGSDGFGVPTYTESTETVQNVIVSPTSEQEAIETNALFGAKAVYTLCIPKTDTHTWAAGTLVEFFGRRWRTVGDPLRLMDTLTPLDWNLRVRVEYVAG